MYLLLLFLDAPDNKVHLIVRTLVCFSDKTRFSQLPILMLFSSKCPCLNNKGRTCSPCITLQPKNASATFCPSAYSVPGLRPLMDINYLPLTDMRIARTFCFANLGQAMYLCSPTEVQRITYSQEICENLQAGSNGGYWRPM